MLTRATVKSVCYRPCNVFAPQVTITSALRRAQSARTITSTPGLANQSRKTASSDGGTISDNLEHLNRKLGEAAAEGIEKTQEASKNASKATSRTMKKINKKIKNMGQDAKEKTQDVNDSVMDKAHDVSRSAKNKADDMMEKESEMAEDATDKFTNR